MPVTMICPNLKCGQTVVANDNARGKVVRCANCQTLFIVPLPREGPPSPPAPQNDDDARKPGVRALK